MNSLEFPTMKKKPFKLGDRVRRNDEPDGPIGEVEATGEHMLAVRWSQNEVEMEAITDLVPADDEEPGSARTGE
jgi:hypothetical protein